MRCGRVDFFGEWEGVRRAVECALRYIVAGARGRVVAVNAVKISRILFGGGPPTPLYAYTLLTAVEEVAGPCVVEHILRRGANGRKRHTIVIDAACLRQRLLDGHGGR